MPLEWSENGESCRRLGKRGALVWKASISPDVMDEDFRWDEPIWAIEYDTRWSTSSPLIHLKTRDIGKAKRLLRSWAEDYDRNEIEARLARDAAKRGRKA